MNADLKARRKRKIHLIASIVRMGRIEAFKKVVESMN